MLSVKTREAADTIVAVFSITQLRIKPSLPNVKQFWQEVIYSFF